MTRHRLSRHALGEIRSGAHLAEIIPISPRAGLNYLTGRRPIPPYWIDRVAEAAGLSPGALRAELARRAREAGA